MCSTEPAVSRVVFFVFLFLFFLPESMSKMVEDYLEEPDTLEIAELVKTKVEWVKLVFFFFFFFFAVCVFLIF